MSRTSFLEKLSLHARHALKESRDIARYAKSKTIEPRHLLLALFLENGSLGSLLLESIGLEKKKLGRLCLKHKESARLPARFTPLLSPTVSAILRDAYRLANNHSFPYVGTEHLASALIASDTEDIHSITSAFNISPLKASSTFENHLHFERLPEISRFFEAAESVLTQSSAKKGSEMPSLDQFATDTKDQNGMSILVGRDAELDRLITILSRRTKNNPLLIGEPGVGKTALVTALADRISRGMVPSTLTGKRILSLDLALIVAGTNFRGEFESRLKDILSEAKAHPEIILFIDEVHTLIGAGNTSGGLDAANILKPALARGEIRCIGATTFTEYKKHIERDPALERRFQPLILREPTSKETRSILHASKILYENYHQVLYSDLIIDLIIDLATRTIPDRFFPDKALDILDEAAAQAATTRSISQHDQNRSHILQKQQVARVTKEQYLKTEKFDEALLWHKTEQQLEKRLQELADKESKNPIPATPVTILHVLTVVSRMTGIPLAKLSKESPEYTLTSLERALTEKLVGQSAISQAVMRALTRTLSGIQHPGRPLGSFLLLGPTGVGKTHLAKVLAREYFGSERSLIRIDMSEFMEKHSVAQMIGAPAGYIGYGEGGKLTERVRRRPSSVVLFDEIEKAHPDVLNILLQVLDEGVLTDAEGRQVNFKNTLILITSNIGTAAFTETSAIGFKEHLDTANLTARFETIRHRVLSDLKKILRPELIARIGDTLVFQPLDTTALEKITRLELDALTKRLKKKNTRLVFRDTVVRLLVEKSFSHEHGARLIRKNIELLVEYPLATALIRYQNPPHITLSVRNGIVTCSKR